MANRQLGQDHRALSNLSRCARRGLAALLVVLPFSLAQPSGLLLLGGPTAVARGPQPMLRRSVRRIYQSRCLGCHDDNGRGGLVRSEMPEIPDFTSPRWQQQRTSTQLTASILGGKGAHMPGFAGKISKQQAQELAAHVRSFAPSRVKAAARPKPAFPRSVVPLFRQRCSGCHDANGRGGAVRSTTPEIPDFTSPRWQRARGTAQLIASILDGKGAHMPAFAGKLGRKQVRDLAAYIRSFGPARGKASATPRDDFEERFRQLQEEFDQLQKQFRALSRRRKP